MRIHFSDNDAIWPRMGPFYNTLENNGHIVSHSPNKDVPDADVWFIEYYNQVLEHIMVNNINTMKEKILGFKGKIIFYGLDDEGWAPMRGLDEEIQDKMDAFMTFQIREIGYCRPEKIAHKFLDIPRYLTEHKEYTPSIIKDNRITFTGLLTGALRMVGNKNWRAESMKLINSTPHLKSRFIGGIVGNILTGHMEEDNSEYEKTFRHLKIDYIPPHQDVRQIEGSTINLCIPGNTIWSYRQSIAMRSKTAIITFEGMENDPYPWMFNDIFVDEFYYVKDDLSNFVEICDYALTHNKETADKAYAGHDLYKKYLELLPNGAYQPHIWKLVREKFHKNEIMI